MPEDNLPQLNDPFFQDWLNRKLQTMDKRISRWKCSLNQAHGVYEYQTARRWKAVLMAAQTYAVQDAVYRERISKVYDLLSRLMERGELPPVIYQQIIDTLEGRKTDV